jgi:hypothetical protein
MDKLITEKLHRCLAQLAKEEQELIFTLFFQNFFLTVIGNYAPISTPLRPNRHGLSEF